MVLDVKRAILTTVLRQGGIQIEGLGATDIDNQNEVFNSTTLGGLALELHRRISTYYGRLERLEHCVKEGIKDADVWRFESRVAELIIKQWLAEFPEIVIIKVSEITCIIFWAPAQNLRELLIQRGLSYGMASQSAD